MASGRPLAPTPAALAARQPPAFVRRQARPPGPQARMDKARHPPSRSTAGPGPQAVGRSTAGKGQRAKGKGQRAKGKGRSAAAGGSPCRAGRAPLRRCASGMARRWQGTALDKGGRGASAGAASSASLAVRPAPSGGVAAWWRDGDKASKKCRLRTAAKAFALLNMQYQAVPGGLACAGRPQRAAAASSLVRASTQCAPCGVCSFFQNGAWVLR